MKPFWRRRREARDRRRWHEHPDDPENGDRQWRAQREMAAFDQLGPPVRQAIATSRFDASPTAMRLPPADAPDDERIAGIVRRHDNSYSGAFGPRSPKGI